MSAFDYVMIAITGGAIAAAGMIVGAWIASRR